MTYRTPRLAAADEVVRLPVKRTPHLVHAEYTNPLNALGFSLPGARKKGAREPPKPS